MKRQKLGCALVWRWLLALAAVSSVVAVTRGPADTVATMTVQVDQPGAQVSTNLFGIFLEEINFAGEGGLYAERVRNRAFGNSTNADYWTLVTQGTATGQMGVDTGQPLNTNILRSLRLTMQSGSGGVGAGNSGYWGMALQSGATYDLSFYAAGTNGFTGPINARLESADGSQLYAQASFSGLTASWQRFAASLVSSGTSTNARIVLSISNAATVWLDMVSLFPHATFRNRTNGMRADLANMLAALKPSFLRFPGGNYIESETVTNAVRWKKTIGDIAQRPGHMNDSWGYWSTDGFGAHEFFLFCEDLGMEPLYDINAGLMLNYSGNTTNTVPLAEMEPWVQDALDLIQYANGDTNTTWGAVRAANGHPAPFNMKYLEIGNENGGSYYDAHYTLFYDAIKSNCPAIHLIAPGNWWGGPPWSRPVEITDEHYYSDPNFFIGNATRYDSYSRSGPKVFVGEYAVTSGYGTYGNLSAALGEAAFMTGMERNSDIVLMASYAPLFANVNGIQWKPDLIYYDSSRFHGTPSYYVQQMFSRNRGDVVLPMTLTLTNSGTNLPPHGAIGLGSWNTSVQYTNIVVTSNGVTVYQSDFVNSGTNGWLVYNGTWTTNNGLYQQTALITDCRSTTGSTSWSNYTITLRARKVSGNEGFLILFNWLDDNDWTWWNIGGWNNTLHGIEQCVSGGKSLVGGQVSGSIQTNQWYDIRIVLNGRRIQCYLNSVLIHDGYYPNNSQLGGAIGLGAWNTANSFTNIVVTNSTGTLYQSDFVNSGTNGWTVYRGTWSTSGGVYQQTAITTDCHSTTGNTSWSDYTITLRARKDGGSEGFLILFNWQDNNNWTWWNIGGWNNTQHAIQQMVNGTSSIIGQAVAGSVANGQWYDIRIVLTGLRIQCYLNNQLIHNVTYPVVQPLNASASYAAASGQIILKAVNVSGGPITNTFNLNGVASIAPQASLVQLTSANPLNENSLAAPTNVFPVTSTLTNAGTNFVYTFPANSLSILRLQTPPTLPTLIGLGVATNQIGSSTVSNGVPVQLSSFITNNISVNYTVETTAGVLANGTLQFTPGDLVKYIPLPLAALQPGILVRVTLSDPVNGQLSGITCVYVVQTPPPDAPLRLDIARFADENLVFWADATSRLQQAGNVTGAWSDVTNAVSPYRFNFENDSRFYRLAR